MLKNTLNGTTNIMAGFLNLVSYAVIEYGSCHATKVDCDIQFLLIRKTQLDGGNYAISTRRRAGGRN